jgi:hypothetical protein
VIVNEQVLRDLLDRVQHLERSTVRVRVGEVTGTAPLDVSLGASTVAYEDVKSVAAGLTIGDNVAVLLWGGDLIVLGEIV